MAAKRCRNEQAAAYGSESVTLRVLRAALGHVERRVSMIRSARRLVHTGMEQRRYVSVLFPFVDAG